MENEDLKKLIDIIKNETWLMKILKDVKRLNLPEWYIAAGAVRNTIFDVLHGFETKTCLNDVDVIYFDESNLSEQKDLILQNQLEKINPYFKFEVINQARVHLFNDVLNKKFKELKKKANSSEDSICFWSETATCIGVRVESDASLTICAPHGVGDLMNLVIRPVPEPYTDLELYNFRLKEKQWQTYWPKITIQT